MTKRYARKKFRKCCFPKGFTLLEFLVAVFIIGLLAAVALPQYNKVVKRARGREALAAVNVLDKALTDYYLEHDSYAGKTPWGSDTPVTQEQLNVQIPELKHFWFVDLYGPHPLLYTRNFIRGTWGDSRASADYQQKDGIRVSLDEHQSMFLNVWWYKGKKTYMGCGPAPICVQYFEGTMVQEGTSYNFVFN